MENTMNELFDFTFWTDDTMGPYKTGFQKQSLEQTEKKHGFILVPEKVEKHILICAQLQISRTPQGFHSYDET